MKRLYKSKWILPKGRTIIENGGLLAQDGLILDVLSQTDLENFDTKGIEVIDFGNSVLTPGFINLHSHLQYTDIGKKQSRNFSKKLLRLALRFKKWLVLKGQKGFVSWIVDLMTEYLCWTEEEKLESFKNGLNQVLLSGTTTIAQLSWEEMFFETLNSSPVRSYIFFEIFADSEESSDTHFRKFTEKYERLSSECSKNVFLGISPHSLYNVHKSLWKKIAEYSRENNVLIHTHFAESTEEIEWLAKGNSEIEKLHRFAGFKPLKPIPAGLDPVSYLRGLGLPWKNVILAHLNQLEDKDMARLAELGVSVAHCPRSNMILHGKTIDANRILQLFPNTIGLGADSLYSNYDLNILNEARFALKTGVELFSALDMLTINAAKALKIDHLTGSLEKKKDADFIVFKLDDNETYSDFIAKETPDYVYISGKKVVDEKKLF